MYLIELYQRGKGTLAKFPSVSSLNEAKEFVEKYCHDNNIHVTARERCGDATWNYLSDGTEIDYCRCE